MRGRSDGIAAVVATLGLGPYEETEYFLDEAPETSCREKFACLALAQLVGSPALHVVCTMEAEERHGSHLDERCTELGLDLRITRIPTGMSAKELWEIHGRLMEVLESIPGTGRICIDVTHAFRAQSMIMAIAAAQIAAGEADGTARIGSVRYGAFEKDRSRTPLIDLQPLIGLVEGFHAVRQFRDTGDARRIADMLYGVARTAKKSRRQDLEQAAAAVRRASERILQGLPLEAGIESRIAAERLADLAFPDLPMHERLAGAAREQLEQIAVGPGRDGQEIVSKRDIRLDGDEIRRELRFGRMLLDHGHLDKALLVLGEVSQNLRLLERGMTAAWLSRQTREGVFTAEEKKSRSPCPDDPVLEFYRKVRDLRNPFGHAGFSATDTPADSSTVARLFDDAEKLLDETERRTADG